jgi:hypothetical protein
LVKSTVTLPAVVVIWLGVNASIPDGLAAISTERPAFEAGAEAGVLVVAATAVVALVPVAVVVAASG